MLLEPIFIFRRVDVGLPNGSKGILQLAGNFPESTMVGLRVGSLANEEVLSVLLALMPSLSVPRCHFKQNFHQRGRLSLFRSNSKHSSGLCRVSLLQSGKYLPRSLLGTSPPPPPTSSLLSQRRCQCFHLFRKAGVGVGKGVNSFGEGGVGFYQFLQHSLTRHRNPCQAVKTTF